jgi:hypothetical protein
MCNYFRRLVKVLKLRKVYVKHVFKCGVQTPWGWHRHAETCNSSEKTYFYVRCNCPLTWFYKWKLSKMHELCNFTIPQLVCYCRQWTQALLLNTAHSFFTYLPCILIIIKVFFYQLMHNWLVLKNKFKFVLKLTLKMSYMFRCKTPSSGSTIFEPC